MGYLKSVGTAVIYSGIFFAFITFLPGLPPEEGAFSEYSITPPTDLDEKFNNNKLNEAEVLHSGDLKGPESFDSYNGQLYTTLHGGYVARIDQDKIVPIVKFGKRCTGIWQEHICGRPLGLKFDKQGNLYVADAYYGIFKVNPQTGKYAKIWDIEQSVGGKIAKIPNSLDIASNGDIYWTDSSTDFKLYDGVYTVLANPSGRLIRYNAATKSNEVLVNGLGFANGLKLSDDETFLIVAETLTSRIVKYYLKGTKAGQKEIFLEGLPGLPDNIHSDGHGGFLISIVSYADSQHPLLFQSFIPHPYIRKMCVRLLALLELPLQLLQKYYPNEYAEKFLHSIGSFEGMAFMSAPKVVVLRVDATGKIIDTAQATNNKIAGISSAFPHNGYLWLGSPWTEYVARIPLKHVFPEIAQNEKQYLNVNEKKVKDNVRGHPDTAKVNTAANKRTAQESEQTRNKRDTEANKPDDVPVKKTVKVSSESQKSTTAKPRTQPTPAPSPKPTPAKSVTDKPTTAKPNVQKETPTTTPAPAVKTEKTTSKSSPNENKKNPTQAANAKVNSKTASSTQKTEPEQKRKTEESKVKTKAENTAKQPTQKENIQPSDSKTNDPKDLPTNPKN